MAGETLWTIDEMLAAFPDNTQNLITPLASRSMIVSEAVNVGYLDDTALPLTIPVVAGTPVDIMGALTAPAFIGNFWRIDGNNHFTENYTPRGVTVNPDTIRISSFRAQMQMTKIGTGADSYRFQWYKSGVPFGEEWDIEIDNNDPFWVGVTADDLTDISLADTFTVQVTGLGTGDDLQLNEALFRATGAPT